jgi:predicted ATP-grasp superfamily ATP-dependent carboligase
MIYACEVTPQTSEAIQLYAFSKGVVWSGCDENSTTARQIMHTNFSTITLGWFASNKLTVVGMGSDIKIRPHVILSFSEFLLKIDEAANGKKVNLVIAGKEAVVNRDGITVGCTTISPEEVEKLAAAWIEVNAK